MSKKQTYVKKDPISHILDRPDMYVGSTKTKKIEDFVVVNKETFKIEKKTIDVSPAILRIFIEPLSNIIDNVARSKLKKIKCSKISIDIDNKTGEVCLTNDGDIIPIEKHEEEKCYNHTMIFGQLLTSSNYDDEQDREDISGRNGLGVKLTCVFSKEFKVEGGDPFNKKTFSQLWKNNMRETSEPNVQSVKSVKPYTKITFTPDFKQFNLQGFTDDILSLYMRFIADTAMITKIPVFFNGKEIPVNSLSSYAKLFLSNDSVFSRKVSRKISQENEIDQETDSQTHSQTDEETEKGEILFIKTKDCEVLLTPSNYIDFECISFANGVYTPLGGTHVDSWCESLFRPIADKFNKAGKPQLSIADIKKYFRLFVVATVKKPEFDSQSKTRLEAPVVKAEVKKSHISKVSKWGIMDILEDIIRAKEMVVLKKAERKKRGYEAIEGLDPANNEGTSKSKDCTLILVEGLSAKTYASWGIQKGAFGKQGRDWFGIYPLRGKPLNCRKSKPLAISKNTIITSIIKAIGLQHDLDYTLEENYLKLRYGRVMIITDSDTDGYHISGLIQNMFHALFPSLLKRTPSYLTSMQTPIVRVYLGKKDILFYNENEYKKYVKENENKKINKKYYKGLGSSNREDVLQTFGQKLVEFCEDSHTFENMNKVFNKETDTRKEWLRSFDPDKSVFKWSGNSEEKLSVTFSDYINTEFIKFSIDDCKRSIPNIMDGLKEGQRKVLYVCFKRNLKYSGKTIKVAQLAGSVSEKAAYHHGEQNLEKTITGMADSYVGSNNIPLLFRDGQFGSRNFGGQDAAAGRYIWTKLDYMTRVIFKEPDDILLDYIEDDGDSVEPRFYTPIIPMVLVNGSLGIGTGWSSNIPCYNPLDLVECVRAWLNNNNRAFSESGDIKISVLPEIKPWYRGHTGEMTKEAENKFTSWGKIEKDNKGNTIVCELPIGLWTENFKETLEKMKQEKEISNYKNYSTPEVINFTIKESKDGKECDLNTLKLSKGIRTTNMVLFTSDEKIKKYNNIEEIIDDFCHIRYQFYINRKKHNISVLEKEIKFLGNKKRFLTEIRDGDFKLFIENGNKKQSRKTEDIISELDKKGYDRLNFEKNETENDDQEQEEDKKSGLYQGYEYLLRLQIHSISEEKINKLDNDLESKKTELAIIKNTSEKELWIRELMDFEVEYKKWIPIVNNEVSKKKK